MRMFPEVRVTRVDRPCTDWTVQTNVLGMRHAMALVGAAKVVDVSVMILARVLVSFAPSVPTVHLQETAVPRACGAQPAAAMGVATQRVHVTVTTDGPGPTATRVL